MTDAANSKKYRDLDLESAICELAHVAAITRFYVSEYSSTHANSEEDQRLDADRIVTAVSHLADMAEDVRKAYYAGAT
jgi:hypothetical protein